MERTMFNVAVCVAKARKKQSNVFPHTVDLLIEHEDDGITKVRATYHHKKRLTQDTVIKYSEVTVREYPGSGDHKGKTMREVIDYKV